MAIMRGVIGLEREAFERDHRLIEIGFGDWEGRSWAELHAAEAKAIRARKADPFNFVVPGGESYAMVMRRVEGWIRTLKRDVVVCSHGGVMRCVRGYFEQADEKAIPHLEVPQDVVMMIEDGAIRWL
jgi:probable phosphoglycerate mutase